jgi:hypothetical protein
MDKRIPATTELLLRFRCTSEPVFDDRTRSLARRSSPPSLNSAVKFAPGRALAFIYTDLRREGDGSIARNHACCDA